MKTYPHIEGPHSFEKEIAYCFHKYDGSNIRAEWSKKRGWYKFGTRKCMLDASDPIFGSAVNLFLNKYGDDLSKIFTTNKNFRGVDSVIVFSEWYGALSFSGGHLPDDEHDIVLFDVNPLKKGMLSPKEFLDTFGHLNVAELMCQNVIDDDFVQSIRKETIDINSKYEIRAEIPEGVVCKSGSGHRLRCCKIKTERYKEKLKTMYQNDWAKFWE